MKAAITHLFLATRSGSPPQRIDVASAIEQRGFDGDRHAARRSGGNRQLLLLDGRSHEALDVAPGVLKENVVLRGLDLEALSAGQRLGLGPEVVVELTGPCIPCHKLDKIRDGLLSAAYGQRGQLAKVLRGGRLAVGEEVTLLDVNPQAPKPIRPRLP